MHIGGNISNRKTDASNLSECDLTPLKTAMSEFIDSNFYKKICGRRIFANLTAIQNVPFASTSTVTIPVASASSVTIPVASITKTKADLPTVANKKTAADNKKISKGKTMAVVPKTIPLKKIIKNGKRTKCTDSDESISTSAAKVEGKKVSTMNSSRKNKKANQKIDEPSIQPPIVVEDTKNFQHILEFVEIIEEELAHSKY